MEWGAREVFSDQGALVAKVIDRGADGKEPGFLDRDCGPQIGDPFFAGNQRGVAAEQGQGQGRHAPRLPPAARRGRLAAARRGRRSCRSPAGGVPAPGPPGVPREAAMAESDPDLRQALWDDYRRYKSGS